MTDRKDDEAHPLAGHRLLFAPDGHPADNDTLVPIRSLSPGHREAILEHLHALPAHDRYLRFGFSATDEHIAAYTDGLNFERDDIFGIYNRKLELLGMAHLALADDAEHAGCAEFGVSVAHKARGRGYGSLLFERACTHSRNIGVDLLFIHALSENTAMLRIARKAGATLERAGSETEAFLRLPPATLDTRVAEMLDEQVARTDYRIKQQARRFWDFLAGLQEVRKGVREGRHKSAE